MHEDSVIWTRKGATLSDKSARQEFGLTQQEIIAAIRAGTLQFREGNMHGNPWFRLFAPETTAILNDQSWPGNVRELGNVIEHAAILCPDGPLRQEHLPSRLSSDRVRTTIRFAGSLTLREIEIQAIHNAIDRHQGNKAKAAEELEVSLKTLYNKLNQTQE